MNTLCASVCRGILAKVHRSCAITFGTLADDDRHSRKDVVDLAYSWYDEHGSTATPLVITHGLLGSKTNWHSLAKALNKLTKRKILTFDLRGHGESPHASNIDYDVMREDIYKLFADQGISKAIAMGHSLGGRAMMNFTWKYPHLVERLICVDISPVQRETKNPAAVYLMAMSDIRFDQMHSLTEARRSADRKLSSVVEEAAIRQFLLTNVIKDIEGVRWRVSLKSLVENYPAFFNLKTLGMKYDGPTLFVGGGKSDYILLSDHDIIKTAFPNSEFASIPDAGHWVHADKPQEFIKIVAEFLK